MLARSGREVEFHRPHVREARASVVAMLGRDPDLDLLEAWRSGDQKAAGKLLQKYSPIVRRVVARKVPDEAIDGVVDRVIEAVLKGHSAFRADAKFRTFIIAIAKRSIADFHRKRERKPDFDVLASSVRDLGVSPSGLLLGREQQRILLEALRGIPLGDQILLELYEWENMPASELAQIYECGVPAIRSRLRRARVRLKEAARPFVEDRRELVDTSTTLDEWLRELREELRPHYFADRRVVKTAGS